MKSLRTACFILLSSLLGHACFLGHALAAPSCESVHSPIQVLVGPLETVKTRDSFEISDPENQFFFLAQLYHGELIMDIQLVDGHRRSSIRGSEAYAQMMTHFKPHGIYLISATWSYGTNNKRFFELLDQGVPAEQAALQTWSGQQATKYGYTEVRDIDLTPHNPEAPWERSVSLSFSLPSPSVLPSSAQPN